MRTTLHELVAKLNAARLRRETLHGREYLVVPTTILRPDSVMNGSKGPLFYPRSEVAKNPGAWNGVPLLLNHPSEGTTGRDPRIISQSGLGYLFNDRLTGNGTRVADAWFDVELVRRHDAALPAEKRMMPRLESGKPIDVSTGLYTDDRPVKNGVKLKDYRGRPYSGDVATNYRPDHLAVLPTTKGACPAPDCGTHVANYNPNQPRGKGGKWVAAGAHALRTTGKAKFESDDSDGGKSRLIIKQEKGQFVSTHYSQTKGEEGFARSEGFHLGSAKKMTHEEAVKKALANFGKVHRHVTGNAAPSGKLDMSPDKACKIVKDGSVHGHPLTDAQRGMFGALCGQRGHAKNADGTCETCTTNAKDALGHGSDRRGGGVASDLERVQAHGVSLAATYRSAQMAGFKSGAEPGRLSDRAGRAAKLADKSGTASGFEVAAKAHISAAKAHGAQTRHSSGNDYLTREQHASASSAHRAAADHYRGLSERLKATTNDEGEPMALTAKQRKAKVSYLTANCECWKDKAETLNELDDEALAAVASQAEQLANNVEAVEAVRETLGLEDELVFNAEFVKSPDMKKKMKAASCDVPDEPEPTVKKNKARVTGNEDDDALQEAIEDAVKKAVADHPTVKNAERTVAKERANLRARLTVVANTRGTTPAKKTLILNKLKDAALPNEQLEELLTLVGEPTANRRHPVSDDDGDPDYTGAGSGYGEVVGNEADATENAEELGKFAADGGMTPDVDWGGRMKEVMNGQSKGKAK